ncbi:flagellar basal-body rod protein FlgB [Panacagrimonas perspica]|uniref:Flagellar basal body rod protein FlgB n=1 Tax=Panacagrimonas perspica TaxID=381431 RepID=A0A4V3US50_9GAMM|nr:flagellar basal body rod protein FlgB [Panacagrimonas perspica]TDU32464.1 flagellar basal-body rod protein FlgB [Panacagrimonas perspica]THD05381.1 flagellar basal-body rod protein FlgB [Panacagrimonas perspica]
MAGTVDPLFGIHAHALQIQQRRMTLLAGNIANADTPGFQARDLDFKTALEQALGNGSSTLNTDRPGHLDGAGTQADPALMYRVPLQPSVDGNTVDVQTEQAAFMDSALRYQASLSFLDGKLKSLLTAITGE